MPPVSALFARRVHLALAGLLAAMGVVLMWTWARQFGGGNLPVAGDAFYTFAAARSLAWDGDIDLTNQLMVLGDRWGLGQAPAADGVRLPVRELGPALLMVPGLGVHALLHASPAAAPQYVAKDDVPDDAIEREKKVQIARVMEEGKPEHIAEKIVTGRMGKYYEDVCLLEQKYVIDDSVTVGEMLTQQVATIGENIKVRRFVRFVLGEGLEKKVDDFAAEVAAQAGLN